MNAVLAVAKAVATLAQRGETGRRVSTATESDGRAACRAARAHTATPARTEPRMPGLRPRGSARRPEGALALRGTAPRARAARRAARGPARAANTIQPSAELTSATTRRRRLSRCRRGTWRRGERTEESLARHTRPESRACRMIMRRDWCRDSVREGRRGPTRRGIGNRLLGSKAPSVDCIRAGHDGPREVTPW